MELVRYLISPLLLTLGIESCILLILKERRIYVYFTSVLMNVITNLSLNLIVYYLVIDSIWLYYIFVIALEVLICILEGLGYFIALKDSKKAILYTLACNLCSFLIGTPLLMFINWIWRE